MENFKLASQQKLRFKTNKGDLSTEQLWDLSLEDLDALAVALEAQHKQSAKKSFLVNFLRIKPKMISTKSIMTAMAVRKIGTTVNRASQ